MNKSILSVPAWRLFLAFFLGATVADVTASMVGKNLGWDWDYGAYPTLRFGLISLVWWSYPYLAGRALSQRSMAGKAPSAHRGILMIFFIAILNNTLSVYLSEVYGVAWYIVLVTMAVNIYCTLRVFSFPAVELKSMKLKRKATTLEAWSELIQFMLWPFCVWWLHGVLMSAATKQVASADHR